MKRFSKIALSVAAVSAVTAAMAISASAMTAEYADGKVTLKDVTSTGNSQTLLVLDTVDLQTVAEANIKQIDQKDGEGVTFAGEEIPVGTLADGTYEVRIGGDGTVQKAIFTVGNSGGEEIEIIVGDANLDNVIGTNDAGYILRASNGQTSRIGKVGVQYTAVTDSSKISVGDANIDGAIGTNDAGYVLRASNGQTSRIGKVGEVIKVTE